MRRALYVLLFSLSSLGIAQNASAGFVLSFGDTPPTEHTPGTPLLVDILLDMPAGARFGSYSIDLTLSSKTGIAGDDFEFGNVIEPSDFIFGLGSPFSNPGILTKPKTSGDSRKQIVNIESAVFLNGSPTGIAYFFPATFSVGQIEILTKPGAGELTLSFAPSITLLSSSGKDGESVGPLPYSLEPPSLVLSQAPGTGGPSGPSGNATVPEPLSLCVWSVLGLAGLFQKPLRKLKGRFGQTRLHAAA